MTWSLTRPPKKRHQVSSTSFGPCLDLVPHSEITEPPLRRSLWRGRFVTQRGPSHPRGTDGSLGGHSSQDCCGVLNIHILRGSEARRLRGRFGASSACACLAAASGLCCLHSRRDRGRRCDEFVVRGFPVIDLLSVLVKSLHLPGHGAACRIL